MTGEEALKVLDALKDCIVRKEINDHYVAINIISWSPENKKIIKGWLNYDK